jgi:serine/threonine protein kinase
MQTDMVSSIALGTLLRQRYLIQQVLGQGGFGRTYLAVDQERFNERCVIKEFVVPYHDDSLIEKARTLFQREASTLYQIQHPQIPRFWSAFESEHQLFLIQDFVQGQTYRSLLQTRKQQGQAFSESEVLSLLNHLLPVLSYLHDRDIIHRDISPENIILRTSDLRDMVIPADASQAKQSGLPVLIDFGAVKEAASHWPIVSSITRVGKIGYAPPEQLQTGNVSPHSDLYALGASCLVLLTGREPQNLLNSQTLAWQWQPYAQISDGFAMVLQKMVALHPSDRYQSAREAWADLQPFLEGSLPSTVLNPMLTPPLQLMDRDIAPAARDSQKQGTTIKTQLFMTSTPETGSSDAPRNLGTASNSRSHSRKWTIASSLAIAASLVITTGIGAHIFRSTTPILSNQQLSATAKPVSRQADLSDGRPKKIQFAPGGITAMVPGNLQEQTMQPYVLEASQGQIMSVTLQGTGVMMNLLRSNGQAIDSSAQNTRNWAAPLPANDQYIIQVVGSGPYSLDVTITPSPLENSDVQRVQFARGKASTTVTGEIQPKKVRRYLLEARTRQLMALQVLKGDVTLSVITPNGKRIGGSSKNVRHWMGHLPMTGEYTIEVSSSKRNKFALAFEVR